jgi:hypothetical protein
MSIEQDSLEVVVPEQLAVVSDEFVTFLKKYYEWMGQDGNPSQQIADSIAERNLWTATQDYLDYLYKEFGYAWIENPESDRANIMARLSDIYKTRGSIDSIKVLFRALFGEEVEIKLPKNFILKPSTGLWAQEYSVICDLISGDPNDVIGRYSTVRTQFPGQPEQRFDVEIKSINPRGTGVYELYISRFFAGFFFDGSTVEFENTKFAVKESLSNIVATTVPGATFSAGDAYSIQHYKRNQTWDYINDELTGSVQEYYQTKFEKYFTSRVFTRWYRDITRINIEKQEQVEQYSFTDGTIVEEVTRDTLTKTIVTRGNSVLTSYKATDGTTKQEQKTIPEGDFIAAPDITINWDDLIIQMIQYVEGIGSPSLASFLEEEVGGYQRGDINNDGVIDRVDIENLLRRVTGRTVPAAYHQWIDQKLGAEIRAREIGAALEVGEGTGAFYRVTEVGVGGTIQDGIIFSFGYNYPTVYTAILVPANGLIDDHAEVVFSSKLVAVSAAEYRDRKGFVSDVNKIFDNYYYQEFSYVVESSLDNDIVENVIQRTVHPAGQKLFSERVIIVNMEYPGIGLSAVHHVGYPAVVSNMFTAIELNRVTAGDQDFPPWNYVEKSLTAANGYPDEFVVDDPLWKYEAWKYITEENGYPDPFEADDYRWKWKEKNLIPGSGYDENLEVGWDVVDKDFYKPRSDAFEISNEVVDKDVYKPRSDSIGTTDYRWKYVEKPLEDNTELFDVFYQEPNKYREDAFAISNEVFDKNIYKPRADGVTFGDYLLGKDIRKYRAEGQEDPYYVAADTYMEDDLDYVYTGGLGGKNLEINDVIAYLFTKDRYDAISITDSNYISFEPNKGLRELLTVSETVDKVIGRDVFSYNTQVSDNNVWYFEKDRSDAIETGDVVAASVYKPRSDSIRTEDLNKYHFDKLRGEGLDISDNNVWYFEKDRSDAIETYDVFATSIYKPRADSIETGDVYLNHIDKLRGNGLDISDNNVWYFEKDRSDAIETYDVFAFAYDKPFSNSTSISDIYLNHLNKNKGDYLSADDYRVWYFEKDRSDSIETDDVVDKDLYKPRSDSTTINDVYAASIEKPFENTTSVNDTPWNWTNKYLHDYLEIFDSFDSENIRVYQSASTVSDVNAYSFSKYLAEGQSDPYYVASDTYMEDDLDYVLTGGFGDKNVRVVDVFAAGFEKPLATILNVDITENLTSVMYKYKTDGLNVSESQYSHTAKYTSTDSLGVTSSLTTFETSKGLTDSLEASSSGEVIVLRDYVQSPTTYFLDNDYAIYGPNQTF